MSHRDRGYLVLVLVSWDNLELEGDHPEVSTAKLPGVGFCPVFASREEAELMHPGRVVLEITATREETE